MKITEIFKLFRKAILKESYNIESSKFWIAPSGRLHEFGEYFDHAEFLESNTTDKEIQQYKLADKMNSAKMTVHFIGSGWIRGQIDGTRSIIINFNQPSQAAISEAIKQINKNVCQRYYIDSFQKSGGSRRFDDKKEAIQYLLSL